MQEMDIDKIVIRGILRHYWKKGVKASEASRIICEFEGENAMNCKLAQSWYRRFESGDMTTLDKPKSGRHRSLSLELIKDAVVSNPQKSTRQISQELNIPTTSVFRGLKMLGACYQNRIQVPHDLTPEQQKRRVSVCQTLLKYPRDTRFLRQILTCDEKWIYYVSVDNKKQWHLPGEPLLPVVKQSRFLKKVLISVWWNYEGIIHFELIPDGHPITSEVYCQQLDRVHEIMQQRYPQLINRKRVLLQQDNARPHTAKKTMVKIDELAGFELIPHPAYSPDLAPSDYHLFRSMAHYLVGKSFKNDDDLKSGCQQFFDSKNQQWYTAGIKSLAERWIKCVEHNGAYFHE